MIKILSALIIGIILLQGCTSNNPIHEKSDIVAVYWHEYSRYSVALEVDNQIVMHQLPTSRNIQVIKGLPPEENMRYECHITYKVWDTVDTEWCVIYIHNIDSIQTGDWNHGKFGRGDTKRIN